MRALRNRKLRLRIALIAMLALLWSQTALAWHGVCLTQTPMDAQTMMAMAMPSHAGMPAPSHNDAALCVSHCDQGTPSPDTARIPMLPAVLPLIPTPRTSLQPLGVIAAFRIDIPPPVPWKRPTLHPAALLLI